ncbi:hypothetical protein CA13_61420 [Planctomycetes bacterium CA13]|uniref:Uncharacterized protein n=1 Tax=Novipirellula herctigrandis TaxID=2527986 RepID=A0A5C5ZBI9_9BACT|nr:hypothetical protein CA13_61420 [Planctomycetes bacterium CA13]
MSPTILCICESCRFNTVGFGNVGNVVNGGDADVVAAGKMHAAGYTFYLSANGFWLTDTVPTVIIE